jgi:hypothetical protein
MAINARRKILSVKSKVIRGTRGRCKKVSVQPSGRTNLKATRGSSLLVRDKPALLNDIITGINDSVLVRARLLPPLIIIKSREKLACLALHQCSHGDPSP